MTPYLITYLIYRAREDPKFKDVKKRPKHYHARCQTCASLDAKRLVGFKNGSMEEAFTYSQQLHQEEVRSWRNHEESVKNAVLRAPHAMQLFLYDDTSCLELPHFTNRGIKNLGRSRINVIPFYFGDYGSGDAAYIYTCKNRFRKGANRLCTTLYHAIRRSKNRKCAANSHLARHLVLQADNYSENKNSDVLLFASELVWRGWYDIIDIEFGPVGHTHNGSDAVHKIHNVTCGSFVSFTLGDFIEKFEHSFRKKGTTPSACVLDVQYDWKTRYAEVGTSERLSGFTNTSVNDSTVSAFRIRRQPSATAATAVEVVWKRDFLDQQWRGTDSNFCTPGFVMLRKLPSGPPPVIPPSETPLQKKHFNELTGPKMRKVVGEQLPSTNAERADDVMEWLAEVAKTGRMTQVNDSELEDDGDDSKWGPLVNVGIPGLPKNCHLIRHKVSADKEDFWKLPEEVEQDMQTRVLLLQGIRNSHLQLPNVRYANARAGNNPDAANNIRSTCGGSSSSSINVSTSVSSSSTSSSTSCSSNISSTITSARCNSNTSTGSVNDVDISATNSGTANDTNLSGTSTCGVDDGDVNDWGARFSDCKDKRMAIQSTVWGVDGNGISVVQVKAGSINAKEKTFQGIEYGCSKSPASPECLKGAFTKFTGKAARTDEVDHSQVLGYFDKLVKKGRSGYAHYLPPRIQTLINNLHVKFPAYVFGGTPGEPSGTQSSDSDDSN